MKICFCLPGSSFTKLNFHSWLKLQRFLDKGDWDYGVRIRYQADMYHVRNGLVLNGDASYIPHEGAEKPFVVENDSEKQYDLSMWVDSVTGDTPILMREDGFVDFVEIQELIPPGNGPIYNHYNGKEVLTRDGWKAINYIKKHKVRKDIYMMAGDCLVKVTGDHSLFLNGVDVKGSSVKVGDVLDKSSYIDENNYESITEEFAELLGFFAAEGSCGIYNSRYSWALNNNDLKVLERYRKTLEGFYGSETYLVESKKEGYVSTWKLYIKKPKHITKDFLRWCYTKSYCKKVPKIILNSNENIIRAFIKGFNLGDGHLRTDGRNAPRNTWTLSTSSYILGAGLAYLYKKMGTVLRVHIRADKPNAITLAELKAEKRKPGINKIIIDQTFEDYVYDIGTDDGTFVGGIGEIVFHNSDIIYEPEDFEKIYRAVMGHPEADMVTGFYMMNSEKRNTVVGHFATEATGWLTEFHYQDKIKEMAEEIKEYDLIPVDFSGFGFVMIKTKVFDAMTYPWFESQLSKRDNGERTFPTSDVYFFKKAKQLGFNLFAHLKVILGHEKMVVLK